MLTKLLSTIFQDIQVFEQGVFRVIAKQYGAGNRAVSLVPLDRQASPVTIPEEVLEELMREHTMLGVPKKRRCVEVRRTRKYGSVQYHWKLFQTKKLVMCVHCGQPREFDRICPTCYENSKQMNEERMKNGSFGCNSHLSEKKKSNDWFEYDMLTPKYPQNTDSTDVAIKPQYEVLESEKSK